MLRVCVFLVVLVLGVLCWTHETGTGRDVVDRSAQLLGSGDLEGALTLLVESGRIEDVARGHLQVALCRKALKEWDAALEGFRACAGRFPEIEEHRSLWIAECFEALGVPDHARVWYERVLESSPEGPVADLARFRIADVSRQAGAYEVARALYERLLDAGPDDELVTDVLFGLMRVQLELDSRAARRTAVRLMESYPKSVQARDAVDLLGPNLPSDVRHVVAKVYLHHREYDLAVGELQEVIRHNRRLAAEAQYLIGKAHYAARQYERAAEAFERAYRNYRYRSALYYLARCADGRDQDEEARAIYERFAARHPNHILADDALWCAAWAYERKGTFDAARRIYLRLNRKYPKSEYADKAAWRAGFMLYRAGAYEEALRAFEDLSVHVSASYLRDQGLFWGGKCLEEMDDPARAEVWFRRASQGFPGSYYSARAREVLAASDAGRSTSAGSHDRRGEVDSKEEVRAHSSNTTLSHGNTRLNRASLLARLGMRREAEAELVWMESADSRDDDALRALRSVYEAFGVWHRALRISARLYPSEDAQGSPDALRKLYPEYYWEEVSQSARENEVDPYLVLSVIRHESFFDPQALGGAEERGLMQILPSTGRLLADLMGMEDFVLDDLYRPDVTVRMGSRFLAERIDAFRTRFEDGARIPLALAAYNAGPGAVDRWISRLPPDDLDLFVESIPYGGTRQYVKLVLRNYYTYEYLYRSGEDQAAGARAYAVHPEAA